MGGKIHHPDRRRAWPTGRSRRSGNRNAARSRGETEHGLQAANGAVGMVQVVPRRCNRAATSRTEHPGVRPRRRLHRPLSARGGLHSASPWGRMTFAGPLQPGGVEK